MKQCRCCKCGHNWWPRVKDPAQCPKCKTYKWKTTEDGTL